MRYKVADVAGGENEALTRVDPELGSSTSIVRLDCNEEDVEVLEADSETGVEGGGIDWTNERMNEPVNEWTN